MSDIRKWKADTISVLRAQGCDDDMILTYFALGSAAQLSGVVPNTDLARFSLGWSAERWDKVLSDLEERGFVYISRQVQGVALVLATTELHGHNPSMWKSAITSLASAPPDIYARWLHEYKDRVPPALAHIFPEVHEAPEAADVSAASPKPPSPAPPKAIRKKRKTKDANGDAVSPPPPQPQTRLMEYYEAQAREAGFMVAPDTGDYVQFAKKLRYLRRVKCETDEDAEIIFRELIDRHFRVYDKGAADHAYSPGTFIVRFSALLTLLENDNNPMLKWWHNFYRKVAGLGQDAPIPFNQLAEIGYVNCMLNEIYNILYSSGYLTEDNTEEEYEKAMIDGFRFILKLHRNKGSEAFVKYGVGGVKMHMGYYVEELRLRLQEAVARREKGDKT